MHSMMKLILFFLVLHILLSLTSVNEMVGVPMDLLARVIILSVLLGALALDYQPSSSQVEGEPYSVWLVVYS